MVQAGGFVSEGAGLHGVASRLRGLLTLGGYQAVTPSARNSTRTTEHLDALYRDFLTAHEPMPDLPSSARGLFAEHADQQIRVLAALAPLSIRVPLYRDPDGWTPIDDWASAELLLELAGANFTHVRLGNRGRDSISYELELRELLSDPVDKQ